MAVGVFLTPPDWGFLMCLLTFSVKSLKVDFLDWCFLMCLLTFSCLGSVLASVLEGFHFSNSLGSPEALFGTMLGSFWCHSAPFWALLGPSWTLSGPFSTLFGVSWGSRGDLLAPFGVVLEHRVVQRIVQGVSRVDCWSIVDDFGVIVDNMFEKFWTILVDHLCLYFKCVVWDSSD